MIVTKDEERSGTAADGKTLGLRQRVLRFLHTRGIRRLEHVHIEVDLGTIVLRGRIATSHDRWLCVNCSQRVAGVLHVTDELELDDSSTTVKRPKQHIERN